MRRDRQSRTQQPARLVDQHARAALVRVVGDDHALSAVHALQQLHRLGAGRGAEVQHAVVRLHLEEERRKHAHALLPTEHALLRQLHDVLVQLLKRLDLAQLPAVHVHLR